MCKTATIRSCPATWGDQRQAPDRRTGRRPRRPVGEWSLCWRLPSGQRRLLGDLERDQVCGGAGGQGIVLGGRPEDLGPEGADPLVQPPHLHHRPGVLTTDMTDESLRHARSSTCFWVPRRAGWVVPHVTGSGCSAPGPIATWGFQGRTRRAGGQ